MKLLIDADACPVAIRDIIIKALMRTGLEAWFVANRALRVPRVNNIHMRVVSSGFDKADDFISNSITKSDLVITNDIPLAAECIQRGALVINTKGDLLTEANIKARLNMRDFMETLRASGIQSGGPAPLGARDIKAFSDAFDRQLTKATQPTQPAHR